MASVLFDNLLANRQAKPRAFGLVSESVADLLELLEDLRLIGGSNPNSGVDDADDHFLVTQTSGADNGTGVGKFDGV
jgi:hypothetical protein